MVGCQCRIYVRLADTTVATAKVVALADRKFKRPFGATIPAALLSAPWQPARAACSKASRCAVRLWLVLARRLRMGEGRALERLGGWPQERRLGTAGGERGHT
jgi:hypothetical protein